MAFFVYNSTCARNRLRQRSKLTAEQKLSMDTFRSNSADIILSAGRQELKSKPRLISMKRMEMRNKALEYWR